MLKNAEEILTHKFTGNDMKDAYMKAVKWYATNVMAKDELKDVLVDFEKVQDEQYPTIILHLYVTILIDEVKTQHCEICKETHSSFYISEETNCNWCKIEGYDRRCKLKMNLKLSYYKSLLGGI